MGFYGIYPLVSSNMAGKYTISFGDFLIETLVSSRCPMATFDYEGITV